MAITRYQANFAWSVVWRKGFERDGIDVQLDCSIRTGGKFHHWYGRVDDHVDYIYHSILRTPLHIEIKPTIGDDYPAVLRQIHAKQQRLGSGRGADMLFVERYTGTGATEQQFVQTFALSQVKVIFRHQVESQPKAPGEGRADLSAVAS